MNNLITLRTSKGEYLPGQTVFGAVYLHICRPTEATGITISFKGLETCIYEYDCEGQQILKNETAHVDFSDVTLYSQAECFEFGSYVFPFKFDLPREIPGTFHCSGNGSKTCWQLDVSYMLKAKAVGADILQTWQPVIIYQVEEQVLADAKCGLAQTATYDASGRFFGRRRIHITAKLIENLQKSGSNMRLRLIVTNPTKIRVTSFRILLLRYLRLCVWDKVTHKLLANMEYNNDIFHIAPEGGPHVVYSQEGDLRSVVLDQYSLELDALQIPLREKTPGDDRERDIPASVVGKHIKNQYQLEISVTFENQHKEMFYLMLPGVLPVENQQWQQWTAPDWAFLADTKLSHSLFSVQESILRTEAFSGLPTFQVL
ncbi:hypothetical protein BsWGS_06912 [Bradybaena similaris]